MNKQEAVSKHRKVIMVNFWISTYQNAVAIVFSI